MYILRAIFAVCLLTCLTSRAQEAAWQTNSPGFHPLAIGSNQNALWVCGPNESIASSSDGKSWTVHHHASGAGAMLFGIEFYSAKFGYAYGTGGTVLFTNDGGDSWETRHFGVDTILLASFSDPMHGLIRTAPALFSLNGSDVLHQIEQPADTLQRFPFTPFLVALSPDKMAAVLSEGPYSESGFLATIDGGKHWGFYDPPSTGIKDLLRVDGKYWATGHEVVGKDKPGGGYGVPMATYSDDGMHWAQTTNDIHPCHWENCGICNSQGCLASGTLLNQLFPSRDELLSDTQRRPDGKMGCCGTNYLHLKPGRTLCLARHGLQRRSGPRSSHAARTNSTSIGNETPDGDAALRILLLRTGFHRR